MAEAAEGYDYAKTFLESHDAEAIRLNIENTLQADGDSLFAGAVLHTYCRAAQLGALQ